MSYRSHRLIAHLRAVSSEVAVGGWRVHACHVAGRARRTSVLDIAYKGRRGCHLTYPLFEYPGTKR
eukprot:3173043-Rhodomonas_salina.4